MADVLTIGDIPLFYQKRRVPLRKLAAIVPLSVFEQLLRQWAVRTSRQDVFAQWEEWKYLHTARQALHAYESWIRMHFDSIDAFILAWRTYPVAVQRFFPASVLVAMEQAIQNQQAMVSNEIAQLFCEQPLRAVTTGQRDRERS